MDLLLLETFADDSIIDGVETKFHRKMIIYASTDFVLNTFPCMGSFIVQGIFSTLQNMSGPPPPG